tara:strand:- start:352 stop:1014 length:663 start_codon:yes stop_codon:yes gene_type:complete
MLTPQEVTKQIRDITSDLIKLGLCDDQSFPSVRDDDAETTEVGLSKNIDLSIVLKNIPYSDLYEELSQSRAFNLKMLDGALIQMMYIFKDKNIKAHRLAFFPSPSLEEYQNNPDIYITESIYADVLERNIVTFPVRFDYDNCEKTARPIAHPRSHLTLGQYKNCRIPVSSAISPSQFIHFILRNFYNTAFNDFCGKITFSEKCFPESLFEEERKISHLLV